MERRNSLGYGRQQSHSCPHPMVCLGMTMSYDRSRKRTTINSLETGYSYVWHCLLQEVPFKMYPETFGICGSLDQMIPAQ